MSVTISNLQNADQIYGLLAIELEKQGISLAPSESDLELIKTALRDLVPGELEIVSRSAALADEQIAANRYVGIGVQIGSLARDDSLQTIAITHQKLSGIAQTSRDDIHWGTLMQSVVSVVSEAKLIDPASNILRVAERHLLGDVGNGASDPSGVVAWD